MAHPLPVSLHTWLPVVLMPACIPPWLQISLTAIREGAADLLVQLLTVASPEIRAAAVFGLGCLVHSGSGPTLDGPQVGGWGLVSLHWTMPPCTASLSLYLHDGQAAHILH